MASRFPPGVDLSRIPVRPPPPGVQSNFIDPPSMVPATIAVGIIFIILTTLFVAIRLYANYHAVRKLALDDFCCVIATILSFVLLASIFTIMDHSRHLWDIPISWITPLYIKKRFVEEMILGPTLFFAKTSVLLLYLYLFGSRKTMRLFIYLGITALFCLFCTSLFRYSYFCAPHIRESWDVLAIAARCNRGTVWVVITSGTGMLVDLFILILPIPVILHLNLPKRKKIQVVAIFLTGSLAILASVLGFIFRVKLLYTSDRLWGQGFVDIMVVVEINLAIICSSMPATASFARTHITHSPYLASLRNRLLSRPSSSASDLNLKPKPKVKPMAYPKILERDIEREDCVGLVKPLTIYVVGRERAAVASE